LHYAIADFSLSFGEGKGKIGKKREKEDNCFVT